MSRWLTLLAAGGLALCLGACSTQLSWPDQTDLSGSGTIALAADATVGQTFVALEAGLNGIDVYLTPQGALQGDVKLALEPAPPTPGSGSPIATATMKAQVYAAAESSLEAARLQALGLWADRHKAHPDFGEGIRSFVEKRPPKFEAFTRL